MPFTEATKHYGFNEANRTMVERVAERKQNTTTSGEETLEKTATRRRLEKPEWKGLVERVMERHGFTRDEALEEIEKFGG